jgi:hypothetical protein
VPGGNARADKPPPRQRQKGPWGGTASLVARAHTHFRPWATASSEAPRTKTKCILRGCKRNQRSVSQKDICPSTWGFWLEGCSTSLGGNGSDDFRIVEVAGANPVTSTRKIAGQGAFTGGVELGSPSVVRAACAKRLRAQGHGGCLVRLRRCLRGSPTWSSGHRALGAGGSSPTGPAVPARGHGS